MEALTTPAKLSFIFSNNREVPANALEALPQVILAPLGCISPRIVGIKWLIFNISLDLNGNASLNLNPSLHPQMADSPHVLAKHLNNPCTPPVINNIKNAPKGIKYIILPPSSKSNQLALEVIGLITPKSLDQPISS